MGESIRRALITGATSGIGRAIAELLARNGIEVGVLAENPAQVAGTVHAIQESGASAFAVDVDLSKREQVEGLIDRLEEEEGPIDILINCAGIGLQAQTLEIREADMRLLFEVNHFAMVALSRDAFRHMAERRRGNIVNVSSCAARRGLPGMATYASTKAAMHAFSQALRVEGMGVGVHVTEVLPMSVRTPFFQNARNRSAGAYEGSGFAVTPEAVAQQIWSAIRRPKPEVYTSLLARIILALDGINPRWLDRAIAWQRRRAAGV